MNRLAQLLGKYSRLLLVIGAVGVLGLWHYLSLSAYGAQLGSRSLKLGSNEINVEADYLLSFSLATAGPLGSILIQFCSNDPLFTTPCVPPSGFDASSAVLSAQTGETGFSISNASTANEIILTRPATAAAVGPASYHFTTITNPSSPGSYYVRVQTYATADATGPASDYGGIAYNITEQLSVTALVPPYLTFCTAITIPGLDCLNASGDYIDFGELSSSQSRQGTSQLLVATNALDGYSVTAHGTTMTSGNNAIAALTGSDVSRPGTPQFGFNLRGNVAPAIGSDPAGPGVSQPQFNYNLPNVYRFNDGEAIIAHPGPDDVRVYTASYVVNVPPAQAPGIYVTTLTYIALADF